MKVLFIANTWIGDAVLSSGLIGHIIETRPGARLTIACGPTAAPMFEMVPGLERLIVLRKRRHGLHWPELWSQVAPHYWSLVVDMRASTFAWLLLARERHVFRPPPAERIHRVRQMAAMMGLTEPPAPRLWTAPRHEAAAAALMPDRPVLALGPSANWRGKIWRPERFAELVTRLTAPGGILPGASIAVLANADQRAAVQPVLDSVPPARRVDLIGNIDLLTVYACLKRCALYIGNDSGLMHMASAAKTPTLGLFGPSRTENFAPWGEHCAAVRTAIAYDDLFPPGYDHRTTDTLMDTLSVDAVVAAAEGLWRRVAVLPQGARA